MTTNLLRVVNANANANASVIHTEISHARYVLSISKEDKCIPGFATDLF